MNVKYFTMSNFNNGQCLAFPFTYDKSTSLFMFVYGIYSECHRINPKVAYWFSDIYDMFEDIYSTDGYGSLDVLSEENLYKVPFGYDGTKMQANITDRIVCISESDIVHIDNSRELNIPFFILNGKYTLCSSEMFDVKKEVLELLLTLIYSDIHRNNKDIEDGVNIIKYISSKIREFEDGLKYELDGNTIEYGYVKSYEEIKQNFKRWDK